MRRALGSLLLVLTLAAAAAAAPSPRDPKRALTAADVAFARRIVVKRADLPPGRWRAVRATDEPDVRCPGLYDPDYSDLTLTGKAMSPDFDVGEEVGVASEAEIYRTAADARAAWRRGLAPGALPCLRRELARLSDKDVKVTVLAAVRRPFPRLGGSSALFSVVVRFTPRGEKPAVGYFDLIGLHRGRAIVTVEFFRLGARFAAAHERAVAAAVAGRMRASG